MQNSAVSPEPTIAGTRDGPPLGDAIRPRVLARRAACTCVSFRYALNDNIGKNTSHVVALKQVPERRQGNALALAANRAGPVPRKKAAREVDPGPFALLRSPQI